VTRPPGNEREREHKMAEHPHCTAHDQVRWESWNNLHYSNTRRPWMELSGEDGAVTRPPGNERERAQDGRTPTLYSAQPGTAGVVAQPPLPKQSKMPVELPEEDRGSDPSPVTCNDRAQQSLALTG